MGGGYVIRRANGTVGWAFNVPAIDQRRVWLLADGAGEWVR